jgi:hypothetical protein
MNLKLYFFFFNYFFLLFYFLLILDFSNTMIDKYCQVDYIDISWI